ncbi:MAG: hypothetical protein ABSG42_09305 [Nitrospirota bacterium]
MYSEDTIKKMLDMFSNPLFKKSFFDFFVKMQVEGIESAKRLWSVSPITDSFPDAAQIFEKMIDFYIVLGFVPHYKYEEVIKDNERQKREIDFLRETVRQLQESIFTEAGDKAQEIWGTIIDKQFEMNKDISRNFFDLFKELK